MRAAHALAIAVWLCGGGRAIADEIPHLFVTWEAPQGCPERGLFLARVSEHLSGKSPSEPMHVEVQVASSGKELELTLRTRGETGDGERVLHGKDCSVLAETAALTLALSIAPASVKVAAAEPPPEDGLDDEVPPGQRPAAGPAEDLTGSVSSGGSESGIPTRLRAGMSGESGNLPGFATGVGGGIGVVVRPWLRVEALGSYWFERHAVAHIDRTTTADLSAAVVELRMCADLLRLDLIGAGLCAGAEAIRMKGVGTSGRNPLNATRVWVQHAGGPTVAWKAFGPLWFRADVQVVWRPWENPQFTDTERTGVVIHQANWVSVRGGLGLEAHFQ